MTTTTIKALLKAALFTGAVCMVPRLALADDEKPAVPDHAEAVAGDNVKGRVDTPAYVPDHVDAQARGDRDDDTGVAAETTPAGIPDHQEAEDRGGAAP
jgi:hypothetical protein